MNTQPLKVFDLNGILIKIINQSKSSTFLIDVYYDIPKSKNYVISASNDYIQSYDYNENKIYYTYLDSYCEYFLMNTTNKQIIKLLVVNKECIYIFNFHTGDLLNQLYGKYYDYFNCCCFYDNCLIVGSKYGKFYLFEITNERNEDYIKKFYPKSGYCG